VQEALLISLFHCPSVASSLVQGYVTLKSLENTLVPNDLPRCNRASFPSLFECFCPSSVDPTILRLYILYTANFTLKYGTTSHQQALDVARCSVLVSAQVAAE
jgi:hypothetical protein